MPGNVSAEVAASYRARATAFAAARDEARQRAGRISNLRLLAFVIGALLVWLSSGATGATRIVAHFATLAVAATFVVLAILHGRERARVARLDERRGVCERGELRVRRAWSLLEEPTTAPASTSHPFAADLDVFGHASLIKLLDVTSAVPGRGTLVRWLLQPDAAPDDIEERQRAVDELRPLAEWRESLTAHARAARGARETDCARFLAWAEGEPWLSKQRALLWAVRSIPALTVALIVLHVNDVITRPLWGGSVALALLLMGATRARVQQVLQGALAQGAGLAAQASMLAHASQSSFAAPLLVRLAARLAAGGQGDRALARLGKVLRLAEVRYSPMLHAVLQALVLWDLHVVAALERWQVASGSHARDWLAALGELEALSAFATLAYDNPDWALPALGAAGIDTVAATTLGHPLIAEPARVHNDVSIGPPGTFLLVTGSNMSGKSTLLRAIGLNVVLAQAGAPVCAQAMTLPLVRLHTSIRIQDSLEEGLSLFMAELMRLKQIVDSARGGAGRPLLFLLDEILHGTNTAERRVAARTILHHLVRSKAIGAVTTHDLTLADDPELSRAARPVHFTETFATRDGHPVMTFDYRLRHGLATSANALKLLEMMGLGERS